MVYKLYNRKSIRLSKYDYSSTGMYFITICTHNRRCLFGDIINNTMQLNEIGKIIEHQWVSIIKRFPDMQLDKFVIMPNHIHGIIHVGATLAVAHYPDIRVAHDDNEITNRMTIGNNRATARVAPTIGQIIGAFKSLCVSHCLRYIKNKCLDTSLGKLWQRNYYERVIRNNNDLNKIREYIMNNPNKWQYDCNYL